MDDDHRPIRMLHLEDDANDAQLIKARLTHGGLLSEIHRVDNGPAFEEALAHRAYDLILVDYSMPGYDGRRAVLASRQRRGDVPVIVISGMASGRTPRGSGFRAAFSEIRGKKQNAGLYSSKDP